MCAYNQMFIFIFYYHHRAELCIFFHCYFVFVVLILFFFSPIILSYRCFLFLYMYVYICWYILFHCKRLFCNPNSFSGIVLTVIVIVGFYIFFPLLFCTRIIYRPGLMLLSMFWYVCASAVHSQMYNYNAIIIHITKK